MLQIVCVTNMVYDEDPELDGPEDWIRLDDHGKNWLSEELSDNIFRHILDEKNVSRISIYRKGFEQFLTRKEWESESDKT